MTPGEAEPRLPDRGLQAERTSLAWTRASLAVWANGGLLLARDLAALKEPARLAGAALASAVALALVAIAVSRQRTFRHPDGRRLVPRRQIHFAGVAILCLVLLVSVTVAITARR
jgi:uncharacterized membrane protein YidH (DUF202 family)